MNTIDIIIVNWNSGRQLYSCLKSISDLNGDGFKLSRVVVVDNASTDNSIEGLEDLALPMEIIRNNKNIGFAAACNKGAKNSKADYLLFLNPDTKLFNNSLIGPLTYMEKLGNERVGICGIQLVDEKSVVKCTCARFPTLVHFISKILGLNQLFPNLFSSSYMTEWDHMENKIVDQVMGAYFLVRHSLFKELDGFDERFFVYFEDVDFSLQAYKAGWKSVFLSESKVYHKGGGISEQIKAKRLFYSLRSRILYGYKHFRWLSATSLMLLTLFVEPWTRLVWNIIKGSNKELVETFKAYFLLWKDIQTLLKRLNWDDKNKNTSS